MKKIAIVTINSFNFGNRLQNYALQHAIESLGYSAETIKRGRYIWDDRALLDRIKNTVRTILGTKKGLYISFDKKYIKYSKYYATPNTIDENVIDDYDFFIAGSDQIWNPYYSNFVGLCDLLAFAPQKKRISYAASFGVEAVPEEKKKVYSEEISKFKAVSVRESKGVEIARELGYEEAKLVLDPTLLLSEMDWSAIAQKPRKAPDKKYMLVYLLGGCGEKAAKEIEEQTTLEKIDILKKNPKDREPAVGPAEFLWLIKNAELVMTDSFHATVFSILFRKPIRVFQRDGINMSSRIRSLAEVLGLSHNMDHDGVFRMDGCEDYSAIHKKLDTLKSDSIMYLMEALAE